MNFSRVFISPVHAPCAVLYVAPHVAWMLIAACNIPQYDGMPDPPALGPGHLPDLGLRPGQAGWTLRRQPPAALGPAHGARDHRR